MGEVWQLFIDESGNFDDPEEPVIVAGLLLRATDGTNLRTYLRKMLERAYPFVPYPHHASHLNLVASRVAAAALHQGEPTTAAEREALDASRRAVGLVRSAGSEPLVAPLARAIEAGQWPDFDALQGCERWLRIHHSQEAQCLGILSARQNRQFAELVRRIPVEHGFALAARDAGDLAHTPGDRYLALLEVLLERVLLHLRGCEPVQQVWVHVANRLAIVADLPVRVLLRARDVGSTVRRAEQFPWHAPSPGKPDARVRLVPHQTSAFKPSVHPGIVWADFIANRTRRRLGSDVPWTTVLSDVRTSLGFALAAARSPTEPQLPMVASSGPSRDAIQRRFAGEAIEPPRGEPPRWIWDQAAAWMEVGP